MSMSLTPKQAELLSFVKFYIAESGGVAPSFTEMMEATDIASKSGIHRLLVALEERGKLVRIPARNRAIRIIEDGLFDGIPSNVLIEELARRGEFASEARKAA